MSTFWKPLTKTSSLILNALKPVFLIGFIFLILLAVLFSYDRVKTIQERRLGSKLADGLDVQATCTTDLIGPKKKFDFKFVFTNNNSESIFVERFGIDFNLLGSEEKSFSTILETSPASSKSVIEEKYLLYEFARPVEIPKNSKKEISIAMQTNDRSKAKANPNTIVIYNGEVSFFLSPEMTNTANCKIQVRYPQ